MEDDSEDDEDEDNLELEDEEEDEEGEEEVIEPEVEKLSPVKTKLGVAISSSTKNILDEIPTDGEKPANE